jgi:hypothetical protein
VAATMAQAKLLGFVVDRAAVLHGNAENLHGVKSEQEIPEDLRIRLGADGARHVQRGLEAMRRSYEGDDIIDGQAEDGGDNG